MSVIIFQKKKNNSILLEANVSRPYSGVHSIALPKRAVLCYSTRSFAARSVVIFFSDGIPLKIWTIFITAADYGHSILKARFFSPTIIVFECGIWDNQAKQ